MSENRGVFMYLNEAELSASLERARKRAASLTTQMDKITDKASPEFLKLSKQLDQTTTKIGDMSQQLDGKLGPSLKQIEASVRRTWNELANIPVGTPDWKSKMAEFTKLNGEFIKIKQTVGSVGQTIRTFAQEVKSVAAGVFIGNTVQAALQQVSAYFNNIVQNAAKVSDELSNIQKTTNLTSQEVRELNDELKKLDTRTSMSDLRQIAAVGGQFNVAKKDLAGFVEAVDKANVALGDEFGGNAESVATELSKLRNIFTDIKTDKIDTDLLNIGNALNALGNDGAATSNVVADFSNRIAGVGVPLGLTTAQVLGISATLQELGVTAERGGTAVSRILQKMTLNVVDFAKIAGVSTQEFSDLLNNDLYKAFDLVVQGSTKAGEGATIMANMLKDAELQGSGASEVFLKLSQNTGMMAQKVELAGKAIKGTDSIMAEFNSKNNNTAAQIEKLQKVFAGYFSGLNSLVEGSVATLSKWFLVQEDEVAILEKTRAELDLNLRALQNVNLSEEARVTLIRQVNEKYGEYLPNLIDEKASLEEINALQMQSNKLMMTKILTLSYEKELTELLQQQASAYRTVAQAQIDQAKLKTPTFSATGNTASEADVLLKQAQLTEQIYGAMPAKIDKQIADLREKFKRMAEIAGLAFEDLFGGGSGGNTKVKKALSTVLPDGDVKNTGEEKGKLLATAMLAGAKAGFDVQATAYNNILMGINTQFDLAALMFKEELAKNYIDQEEYAGRIENLEIRRTQAKLTAAKAQSNVVKQASDDVAKYQMELDNKVYDATIRRNNAIANSTKETAQKVKENFLVISQEVLTAINSAGQLLTDIIGNSFAIQQEQNANEFAAYKQLQDDKRTLLDRQLEAQLISQQEYDREVLKLELETRAREKKMKREQFVADKNSKMITAGINTALAVVNALATAPFPLAAIQAAFAAATGAVQIGFIARQPIPEFGDGGKLDGPSHDSPSRGLWVYDPEKKRVVSRLEGQEHVTRKSMSAKYDGLLTAINSDDTHAIAQWYSNQPKLNMDRYNQVAVTHSIVAPQFDDQNITHALERSARVTAKSANYIVHGVVDGFAAVVNTQKRKL